jgi:hypothetical protein
MIKQLLHVLDHVRRDLLLSGFGENPGEIFTYTAVCVFHSFHK